MLDQRIKIASPTYRKIMMHSLTCDAPVFIADFDDAESTTRHNMIGGQINLREAVRRKIALKHEGKKYKLDDKTVVLMARPRDWHLNKRKLLIDGEQISGSLSNFTPCSLAHRRGVARRGSAQSASISGRN